MHSQMQSPQLYPKRRSEDVVRTLALMGTFVTIHVVNGDVAGERNSEDAAKAVDRAFQWFYRVEQCCTRFDPQSELMRLAAQPRRPVRVSALLYEAVQFALALAEASGGAFDPTVGSAMERRGFNREYRTGNLVPTMLPACDASYRDVRLDPQSHSITLLRPLVLDLGAVAKGLAVDLAARELEQFKNFAINAGGDLYLAGRNPEGEPWSIGIRHPRRKGELIDCLRLSNCAVCTSGDYERPAPAGAEGHHILNPSTGLSPNSVASVTAIAPSTMLADAVGTAAFVLGPARGLQLFGRLALDGLIISTSLERFATRGFCAYQ